MNKRFDLINYYIKKYNFKSFLEIGVFEGETQRTVVCEKKISVDPDKNTNPTCLLTSDEFFKIFTDKFDIIFIDGLHEYSQVDRDIKNSLNHLNIGGVIIMHDCHPIDEACQRHSLTYPGGEWTGDCWKAYVKNRAELPYEMYVWDNDWGCGVIDTNKKKVSDTSKLPVDMDKMTYQDFISNPEWMNFMKEIPKD